MMPCITDMQSPVKPIFRLFRMSAGDGCKQKKNMLPGSVQKKKKKMGILEYLVTSLVLTNIVLLSITFCSSGLISTSDLTNIRDYRGNPA
jgi:hypothetical protein